MTGLLLWKEPQAGKRQKNVRVAERSVLHMRFICVEMVRGPRTPEAVLRRRVLSAARALRKAGVIRTVVPEGFAYGEQLAKQGIRPVSTLSLRRSLAADLVRAAMAARGLSPGGAKLAVTADQMTGELVRTVTELSLGHRYVLLELPYGGEELARQLRREYGVSLLLGPSLEQLDGAEVLVLFHDRPDLKRKNAVVLPLYEGGEMVLPPLLLPPTLEEKLPRGADRAQLITVLREAGALRPGQITVGTAEADGK